MRPTVATLLTVLALTGCTGPAATQPEDDAQPPHAAMGTSDDGVEAPPARKSLPCAAAVKRELVGGRHAIVGHSFSWPEPFRSPPLAGRHNKILWELKRPGRAADTADLLVTASL